MNYLEWNEAIGRHFFNSGRADERIYLIVEPQTLADVATAPFPTSEDAQKAFVAQVCRQIVRQGWKVGHLGRDCYPSFMGLLAFQVLAAYLMQASEDWTAAAYWPQVRKLLDQEQISRMPPGLNGETHQSMWRSLEVWANNEPYQGGGWGVVCLPQDRTGPHCHIRLPLSQTLLRQEGLSRLPAFFEEVGFRAGEELDSEEVWEEVSTRLDNPKFLTGHGRRVLADEEKRLAACEQICAYLYLWDGSIPERPQLGKSEVVRLWVGVRAKSKECVGGFVGRTPTTEWSRLSAPSLSQILGRRSVSFGRVVYRPIRPDDYVLTYDSISHYYVEKRYAQPGDSLIFLTRNRDRARRLSRDADEVAEQLEIYGDVYLSLTGLPRSWTLVKTKLRDQLPERLPEAWRGWVRTSGARLEPTGGLKLSRSVWLSGAGPALRIRGNRSVERVWISGKSYPVVNGEVLQDVLDCPGDYEIWLPGQNRLRLRIMVRVGRRKRGVEHPPERWVFKDGLWPLWGYGGEQVGDEVEGRLHGPIIEGFERKTTISLEMLVVRLALAASGRGVGLVTSEIVTEGQRHPNLLVRALAAAAGAAREKGPQSFGG